MLKARSLRMLSSELDLAIKNNFVYLTFSLNKGLKSNGRASRFGFAISRMMSPRTQLFVRHFQSALDSSD